MNLRSTFYTMMVQLGSAVLLICITSVSSALDTNNLGKANLALRAGMTLLDDTTRLAVGDRINLRILEDEEEPKLITIMQSGGMEVPHIGRFQAVGKTCKQLAYELKAELEKDYFHHATVLIAVDELGRSRGKVYLAGAVRTPGAIEIPPDETFTIGKAIVQAGGFSDYADKRRIKITRKGRFEGKEVQTFVVNLVDVIEKGKTEKDLELVPGDVIFVPNRIVSF